MCNVMGGLANKNGGLLRMLVRDDGDEMLGIDHIEYHVMISMAFVTS